jgi:ABC-type sulfate/molybdate transport systems ATPase subunit
MYFLEVSGISKRQGDALVLNNISLTQPAFRKTAIAGETGSGKSTLLKIIAGLEQAGSGTVLFRGRKVAGPDERLIPGHPGIGYLSQHFELRNNYRVEELLDYANKLGPDESAKLFDVCRISHLLKRKTDQVSGGEKQRIALARLLVGSPKLLLLDEPFSNMDPIHKNILKSVLQDISDQLQITCLLTSHDPLDTISWADEIGVMQKGEIIQKGTPAEIYHQPVSEYIAGLFGTYNLFDKETAALLPALQNMHQVNGRYFARPEQFRISPASSYSIAGTISKISFWGAYYEMEIATYAGTISLKTMQADFMPGDTVNIEAIQPNRS